MQVKELLDQYKTWVNMETYILDEVQDETIAIKILLTTGFLNCTKVDSLYILFCRVSLTEIVLIGNHTMFTRAFSHGS